MKMWEFLNLLKHTNATRETIFNWLYDNKICPLNCDMELELDIEVLPLDNNNYPVENLIHITASKLCDKYYHKGCPSCIDEFLDSELGDDPDLIETKIKNLNLFTDFKEKL